MGSHRVSVILVAEFIVGSIIPESVKCIHSATKLYYQTRTCLVELFMAQSRVAVTYPQVPREPNTP